MAKRLFLIFGLLGLLATRLAAADLLVLIHGYASGAQTWEFSGINNELQARGWHRGGVLVPAVQGMQLIPGPGADAVHKSFAVSLPAEAPLAVQAHYLALALGVLRHHYPEEKLILTGHSAGGVVARFVLLGNNPYQVAQLITIASPHLGTGRAAQGLDVVDAKPFFCPGPGIEFLKHLVGGADYDYLEDSRGVLVDLLPAGSGNVLSWLNQQPHPAIAYYAVVRNTPLAAGDNIVPGFSQDLNNVPMLQGKVTVLYTPSGHVLNPQDGVLLAGILDNS